MKIKGKGKISLSKPRRRIHGIEL